MIEARIAIRRTSNFIGIAETMYIAPTMEVMIATMYSSNRIKVRSTSLFEAQRVIVMITDQHEFNYDKAFNF